MTNRRILFPALILLLGILACAVPGFPSASDSSPLVDTGQLETMVVETVELAIVQTRQAAPHPTGTPQKTAEPTQPPASTEAPLEGNGSSLAAQSDGTVLFVDELARFQLNVSPGWLPLRINEQEYYDAFSVPAASNAAVQRALMNIKTLDPNTFRLFIYDLQDGHMINGVITSVNFLWDPQGSISLEGEADIKEAAEALATSIPNLNLDSYSIASTANEIPIGVVLSNIPGKTFEGTDVVLSQKQVYLNLPAGMLVVSFTTEQDFKDATLPFFDTMIETLKISG